MSARSVLLACVLALVTAAAQADHPPGPVLPREAYQLLGAGERHPGLVVLDVRTAEEYRAGHLPNAFRLDYYQPDFRERLADLERDVPYLIYCRIGVRSARTYQMMSELGFTQVYELRGGIRAWRQAGLPLMR